MMKKIVDVCIVVACAFLIIAPHYGYKLIAKQIDAKMAPPPNKHELVNTAFRLVNCNLRMHILNKEDEIIELKRKIIAQQSDIQDKPPLNEN